MFFFILVQIVLSDFFRKYRQKFFFKTLKRYFLTPDNDDI